MSTLQKMFAQRIDMVKLLVESTNKSSVLIIQQFPVTSETGAKFPKVRESISNILAFVELGDIDSLHEVIKMADGFFDNIVLDRDMKLPLSKTLLETAKKSIKKTSLFFYSDINTWADTAIQFILQKETHLDKERVMLMGEGPLYDILLSRLHLFGVNIVTDALDPIDVLIGAALKSVSTPDTMLEQLNEKARLYDVGIGNFTATLVEAAIAKGHLVFRIDMRAGMASVVIHILETDYLIRHMMGQARIKEVELVAGGVMGRKNAVVIDDIHAPLNILGVADGMGNFKTVLNEADSVRVNFVKRLIQG